MPRGVWSPKDERQHKHIVESCLGRDGRRTKACKRIAAATVNKQRRSEGRTLEGTYAAAIKTKDGQIFKLKIRADSVPEAYVNLIANPQVQKIQREHPGNIEAVVGERPLDGLGEAFHVEWASKSSGPWTSMCETWSDKSQAKKWIKDSVREVKAEGNPVGKYKIVEGPSRGCPRLRGNIRVWEWAAILGIFVAVSQYKK